MTSVKEFMGEKTYMKNVYKRDSVKESESALVYKRDSVSIRESVRVSSKV